MLVPSELLYELSESFDVTVGVIARFICHVKVLGNNQVFVFRLYVGLNLVLPVSIPVDLQHFVVQGYHLAMRVQVPVGARVRQVESSQVVDHLLVSVLEEGLRAHLDHLALHLGAVLAAGALARVHF